MAQEQSKRPNILYFHVDNIGVGDFGCYGARVERVNSTALRFGRSPVGQVPK